MVFTRRSQRIYQILSTNCDKCGSRSFMSKAKVAEARQIIEIPSIKPIITEYQANVLQMRKLWQTSQS